MLKGKCIWRKSQGKPDYMNWLTGLTAEEIDKELWQGKGKPNQLYGVIHHLRESLKGISSLVVEYRDEHYCLKMPHSIEKNTEKG